MSQYKLNQYFRFEPKPLRGRTELLLAIDDYSYWIADSETADQESRLS